MESKEQTVMVFGPTGSAGSGVVQACLADGGVAEVRAVTRRSLGVSNGKLTEVMCSDFEDLSAIGESLRGVDACLFCLGITARKVKDEAEYRTIHLTYPMVAARALQSANPDVAFVYLSGAGAATTSRMMWARVKAEAEDELGQLGLRRFAAVRPALIIPENPGFMGAALSPLVSAFSGLGIRAKDLGRAMLATTRESAVHSPVENRALRSLAQEIT